MFDTQRIQLPNLFKTIRSFFALNIRNCAITTLYCSFVSLPSGFSHQNALTIDPDWLARIKTEGRRALSNYEYVAARLEESYEAKATKNQSDGTKKYFSAFRNGFHQVTGFRLDKNVACETTRVFDDSPTVALTNMEVQNEYYRFRITKNQPREPYVLIGVDKPDPRFIGTWLSHDAFRELKSIVAAADGSQDHRLTSVKWHEHDRCLDVQVSVLPSNIRNSMAITIETRLEPLSNWRVVAVKTTMPGSRSNISINYGVKIDEMWFPNESTNIDSRTTDDPHPSSTIISKLLSLTKSRKTPADFRLPAFGLIEPSGYPSATPSRLWIGLFVGLLLVIAVLFCLRWKSSRKHGSVLPYEGHL